LFGRDNGGLFYYRRVESGAWTVQGEVVAPAQVSAMVSIAVGTSGAVMAAYRTGGNNFESDIYVGVRGGDGRWAMENISSNCCTGCPAQAYSYMPALAADPSGSGGIRLLWADEQCEPRTDPRQNDLYYREWLPGGGWTGPPARIVRDPGDAYENSLVVDSTGVSHIVFAADAGTRSHGNYRLFYVSGRGDKFSAPVGLFPGWGREATFHKSPALDYSNGWLHLAFDSDHEGSKEVYYSNKGLGR
jgi:hypothetical protein